MASNTPPHYLRFARAIALVAITGSGAAASGCCPLVPTSMVCDHCNCPYGGSASLSRPVECETIGRQGDCCFPPVPGPLPPPNLAAA